MKEERKQPLLASVTPNNIFAMLSYFQFLLLPPGAKVHYLRENGTFLLSRQVNERRMRLYALHDFLVELCYREDNQVAEVIVFKKSNRLKEYLEDPGLKNLTS